MLLYKNRAFQRAPSLALDLVIILMSICLLFLDTDKHFCEKVALQILP